MKKLRLIITTECNKKCSYCCNKEYDLAKLPRVNHFDYEEIIITGGEPLININRTIGIIETIRVLSKAKIYIYTALTVTDYRIHKPIYDIVNYVDRITLSLHTKEDSEHFNHVLLSQMCDKKTFDAFSKIFLRLNVMENIKYKRADAIKCGWIIKDNIKPLIHCPIPTDEVLMIL